MSGNAQARLAGRKTRTELAETARVDTQTYSLQLASTGASGKKRKSRSRAMREERKREMNVKMSIDVVASLPPAGHQLVSGGGSQVIYRACCVPLSTFERAARQHCNLDDARLQQTTGQLNGGSTAHARVLSLQSDGIGHR